MCSRGQRLSSSWAPCMMTAVRRRNQKWSSTTTKQKEWTQWMSWLATTRVSGEPQGGPWFSSTACWMLPPSMPDSLVIWVVWTMHQGAGQRACHTTYEDSRRMCSRQWEDMDNKTNHSHRQPATTWHPKGGAKRDEDLCPLSKDWKSRPAAGVPNVPELCATSRNIYWSCVRDVNIEIAICASVMC